MNGAAPVKGHSMIAAFLALALATASGQGAADVIGLWKTPVDGGLVRIEACGEAICGHVVSGARLRADPAMKDVKNHDPTLRTRPIKGLLMLKLSPKGPGQWGDGWVYNPDDGATYKGSMKLTQDGHLRLQGCVVVPLCKTQTWTRAE
jgi:uncharacterized protein (DUF2147 family)